MKYKTQLILLILSVAAYMSYSSGIFQTTEQHEYIASMAYNGWEKGFDRKDKPRNPKKAAKHYKIAAQRGSAKSQNKLGAMYSNGDGLKQDHEKAAYWWSKAAEQDYPWALNNMGTVYANGTGVAKDTDKAKDFYKRAIEKEHKDAEYNLKMLEASLSNDDTAIAETVFKRLEEEEEKDKKRLRNSLLYKKLEKEDRKNGYSATNMIINEALRDTGKLISNFRQSYLFVTDKVSSLHEQDYVDPEYYHLLSGLSLTYTKFLKKGLLRSPNLAESYNMQMEAATRFYQSYLLSVEDFVRCKLLHEKNIDIINAHKTGPLNFYEKKNITPFMTTRSDLEKNTVKHAVLKLSDLAKNRKANSALCSTIDDTQEPEFISDEAWQIEREKIRERFLVEVYPK